jgi:hypothetical protein
MFQIFKKKMKTKKRKKKQKKTVKQKKIKKPHKKEKTQLPPRLRAGPASRPRRWSGARSR